MKWLHLTGLFITPMLLACSDDANMTASGSNDDNTVEMSETAPALSDNPLLDDWDTPFGTPPFDKIESEHYLPAIRAGMAERRREIDAIIANPDKPTFANTIEALEASGKTYSKV